MDVTDGTRLQFKLEWDRDLLLRLCAIIREVFWPVSVFLIHPLVLFVLIRKTKMDLDCKLTFVIHDVITPFFNILTTQFSVVLILFDVYNGCFYQFYTLLPYPIFVCTGILCGAETSHRLLLTILAFLTISMCVPYLFVMMRMHQKIIAPESRAKLSKSYTKSLRSQVVLMCIFTALLVSNVFGFGLWSGDSPDRDEILKIPDVAWAKKLTSNFLVFGKKYGDIGLFHREMYLLLFSIFVCFGFYALCTYHAVFVSGKENAPRRKSSKTFTIQLRFMISMAIQACLTTMFFIAPLFALGIAMATPIAHFVPAATLPFFRILFVAVYSCCSCAHSIVFLAKSTYIIQKVNGHTSPKKSVTATAVTIGLPLSQFPKDISRIETVI